MNVNGKSEGFKTFQASGLTFKNASSLINFEEAYKINGRCNI